MTWTRIVSALLAGVWGAAVCNGADIALDEDRMAVVNGERTFILGLYENPASDEVLEDVAQAGFNLVQATADEASLDRLQKHGLWAWLNTGYAIDLQEARDTRTAALTEMAADFAAHPAFLIWEVPDEALWNCWYGAWTWRKSDEPKELEERIDGLSDTALAENLRAQLKESRRLLEVGEYAQSEAMADAIWTALGASQPRPGLNVSNAADRAAAMAAGMKAGYDFLRALDPAHPVWMNHAPRNQIDQLAAFNRAADIVGCDIYPVPRDTAQGHSDIAIKTVASVGAYTKRMQDAAPGKPVWMVLQGFGWNDLQEERDPFMRRPKAEETRFMAYDAIVHGARGILYWGTYQIERDSALWTDILAVAKELDELQPVLSARDTALPLTTTHAETWGSVDTAVAVLGKDGPGGLWVLAVNDWHEPLRYTIHGLRGENGSRYRVRGTDTEVTVSDNAITLLIPGHGVQMLEPVRNEN